VFDKIEKGVGEADVFDEIEQARANLRRLTLLDDALFYGEKTLIAEPTSWPAGTHYGEFEWKVWFHGAHGDTFGVLVIYVPDDSRRVGGSCHRPGCAYVTVQVGQSGRRWYPLEYTCK
jgi:hypothetical protein